jgi:hypothetical protein
MLGSGLLLIVTALHVAPRVGARWPDRTLVVVVVVSTAQLLRSAVLYTLRP